MKFAHTADCHVGGWREEEMKQLSLLSFQKMIDCCIQEHVAFLLISGDLFNTSIPQIDLIKEVTNQLRRLKEENIDVYIIPGSHDYSPSGKTMIDVLEKAGLCHNVFKLKDNKLEFTVDKTNVKITGVIGLAGGLEKAHYKVLDKTNLEAEKGFKIFMFHTLLNEFRPKELEKVEGESYTLLPKGFDYYAGGHPHFVMEKRIRKYGVITYPGPLMPNNFKEIEELKQGGFFIGDEKMNLRHIPIKIKEVIALQINADNKTPLEVEREIEEHIKNHDLHDKIVTLRVEGTLKTGKPSDINFLGLIESMQGAYCILKNTYSLTTQEFEEVRAETGSVEQIEEKIIQEHVGQIPLEQIKIPEEQLTRKMLTVLNKEKSEGERKADFEGRLIKEVVDELQLAEVFGNHVVEEN
ncbi:DNA repair exonuclease [Candidatus Woesearchaeota archaeon]|nr:DNA repair exonuclease [Candidatus Woesearchaeota archaeon]